MRLVEAIIRRRDKCKDWENLRYIVSTFINVMMYQLCNNNMLIKKIRKGN
jgi:hypothetical protein